MLQMSSRPPWLCGEDDERAVSDQVVSLELFGGEDGELFDIVIEYDWSPAYHEAYVSNWYVTNGGRTKPIDWHCIGVTLDEIFAEADCQFKRTMNGELVW